MELQTILLKHQQWRRGEFGGARADLCSANLSGANLYKTDLSGADLSRADLSRANLSRSDLSGANLSGADLSRANLYGTNLSGANLSGADLSRANLFGADLSRADMYTTNLSEATLSKADLDGADLSGAQYSPIHESLFSKYLLPPQTGQFQMYKKLQTSYIAKLLVSKTARRVGGLTGSRKIRVSKVKVLEIFNCKNPTDSPIKAVSKYDNSFEYTVGKWLEIPDFNPSLTIECGTGIHGFLSIQEAIDYA